MDSDTFMTLVQALQVTVVTSLIFIGGEIAPSFEHTIHESDI